MTSPADAPRPGSWLLVDAAVDRPAPGHAAAVPASGVDLAARVAEVPVSGHVEVLTAEHERLHRLLATIDQL